MKKCNGTMKINCSTCDGEGFTEHYKSSYYEQYAVEWEEDCNACHDDIEGSTGKEDCEGCSDCEKFYNENGELIADLIKE